MQTLFIKIHQTLHPINIIYNSLCRFILRCPYRTHHCFMYDSLNWLSPKARRNFHWLLFIYKCIHFDYPPYLKQYLTAYSSQYNLRHTDSIFFSVPRIHKELGRYAFQYKAPSDWNKRPISLRTISSFHLFKKSLFSHLQTHCSCY